VIEKKKSEKLNNQIRIISLLRKNGPLSRKTIAEKLELTRASITILTNELIERGLIEELGEAQETQSRAGRKEILVDLNLDYWYLLGIDIKVDSVSIGLVTIKGDTIVKEVFNFDVLSTEPDIFNRFGEQLELTIIKMINQAQIPIEKIFCCGIGMIGRKRYYQFHKLPVPTILEYRKKLVARLHEHFGFIVTMDNNVRALAVAESLFFSEIDAESYLYIKLGPGLGSALVFEKRLRKGASEQAGEIGSAIVTEFYPQLSKDRHLTLEEIISMDFVQRELKEHWNLVQLPYLFNLLDGNLEKLTIQDIYQALIEEEDFIIQLYQKKMRILAQKIFAAESLLDLDKIYLFFSTLNAKVDQILYKYLLDELELLSNELSSKISLSQISIEESYLAGAEVGYIGAMNKIEQF
jgi:predicted NBD/HSP70 family sugar kinase